MSSLGKFAEFRATGDIKHCPFCDRYLNWVKKEKGCKYRICRDCKSYFLIPNKGE